MPRDAYDRNDDTLWDNCLTRMSEIISKKKFPLHAYICVDYKLVRTTLDDRLERFKLIAPNRRSDDNILWEIQSAHNSATIQIFAKLGELCMPKAS